MIHNLWNIRNCSGRNIIFWKLSFSWFCFIWKGPKVGNMGRFITNVGCFNDSFGNIRFKSMLHTVCISNNCLLTSAIDCPWIGPFYYFLGFILVFFLWCFILFRISWMVLIGFFILVVSFFDDFCILSYFIILYDARTFVWHQLIHNI